MLYNYSSPNGQVTDEPHRITGYVYRLLRPSSAEFAVDMVYTVHGTVHESCPSSSSSLSSELSTTTIAVRAASAAAALE